MAFLVLFQPFTIRDWTLQSSHAEMGIQGVSGQFPTRTIPHLTGIGPNEWFYRFVVALVGSGPRDSRPGGQ